MANEEVTRFSIMLDLRQKTVEHKQQRRILIYYILLPSVCLGITFCGIIGGGLLGNTFFGNLFGTVAFLMAIATIAAIIFFFYEGRGVKQYRSVQSLREGMEELEEDLKTYDEFEEEKRSPQQRYKNQIRDVIIEYQQRANANRRVSNIIQTSIILLSLLVSGLTSGLAITLGITGLARIAPILSLLVSFLAAFTGLFKFRERGFNLQQTADAMELELNSAALGILHYRNIADPHEVLVELAERVENLKDEQRKRQQQLEQPSETMQPTK